jgi:hypothetical protein
LRGHRHARVVHHDRECLACREVYRSDGELVPGALERRRFAVDVEAFDLPSREVEVERNEIFGRPRVDDDRRGNATVGPDLEVKVIVGDVVPTVPERGVVGVSDPSRADSVRRLLNRRRRSVQARRRCRG